MQISFQTLELMQATLFYAILADEAAGQRVRQPHAINEIEASLMRAGLEKRLWEEGWKYLAKYQALVERTVTQNVLIALRSHWDWYIRNLGKFVETNRKAIIDEPLSKTRHTNLARIGFKDILKQLSILEDAARVTFDVSESVKDSVCEMSLVRNLGLHNRWEVDEYYLKETKSRVWKLQEVRLLEIPELQEWHRALIALINATWPPVAERFKDAPPYVLNS